ncbi:MAG: TerB family tellurite resistance protein [Candidatus Aminicenantes bacterium]|nr:TerB family tellurite resistance protein [Candidatus Aminicenantes bacterium]
MLSVLKKYFVSNKTDGRSPEVKLRDKILVATSVLMLEIAKSDDKLAPAEMKTIRRIIQTELEIPKENIEEILRIAEKDRDDSTDIYEYTKLINQHFSREEKIQMVERFWRIIYADGIFDQFEDYMVHKLADLLRLSHDELISAKLKMKPENHRGR